MAKLKPLCSTVRCLIGLNSSVTVRKFLSFFFYYAKQCLIALVLKQRDVALRRLQINEFKDLLGLVFISALLASAGRNLPELSYLSKVTSC